jgi:hypothetical protein
MESVLGKNSPNPFLKKYDGEQGSALHPQETFWKKVS